VKAKLEEELKLLREKLGLLDKTKDKAIEGAKQAQSPGQRLQDAYTKVQGELNELTDPVNQIVAGANAIGSAFGQAFSDVASGAKSAQQALSDAFRSIGEHFINMATQMIAKYIEMKVIGLAMSFLGGGSSAASGAESIGAAAAASFAGGGSTGDGPRIGGLDGQGGYLAMLHPQETVVDHAQGNSGMAEAMRRYRPGAATSGGASGAAGGGGGGGGPITITYSGPMLNFNGDEYLPKSAVPEIIAASAKQGTEGGYAKTLGAMRNNRSTRARLGMNR
jgi:hypothetical protein